MAMGKLPAFRPPLPNEFNRETADLWSQTVSRWIDRSIAAGRGKTTQAFNPMKEDHKLDQAGLAITWTAFPTLISQDSPDNNDRWKKADSNRGGSNAGAQDEYSEWSVNRDAKGRITDITFTSEGPEYWAHFIKHQPQDAIKVIEEMNGIKGVKLEELVDSSGKYNPSNKYNSSTTGPIISLVHDANSLGAEVRIIADATVLRKHPDGTPVTDKDELIECARYGVAGRNSDPEIGFQVNNLVRRETVKVAIKDPVALFMHEINKATFQLNMSGDPAETDLKPVPAAWWNEQRGNFKAKQGLRLKIHNKTGTKASAANQKGRLLDVSDIWDKAGRTFVKFGAQFADQIKIGATGIAAPGFKDKEYPCANMGGASLMAVAESAESAVSAVTSFVASAAGTAEDDDDDLIMYGGYGATRG